jgi:hypothetical protein
VTFLLRFEKHRLERFTAARYDARRSRELDAVIVALEALQ